MNKQLILDCNPHAEAQATFYIFGMYPNFSKSNRETFILTAISVQKSNYKKEIAQLELHSPLSEFNRKYLKKNYGDFTELYLLELLL